VHVNVIEKASDLTQRVMVIVVLRQIDFFLFDRAHQSLRVAILFGATTLGHADLRMSLLKQIRISRGRVLDALIRVMDVRRWMPGQSPFQGRQGQTLI